MYSYSLFTLKSTRFMLTVPGPWSASKSWHATAPEQVCSMASSFRDRVELSQARSSDWGTKLFFDIIPAVAMVVFA